MGNFNRKNTSRGKGNRSHQGDRGDRQMHKATCADCGKDCKIPFKPTSDKPVYCSDCFKGDRKPRDEGRGRRGGDNRGGDRGDRQMHRATCADCGKSCEVPFRPSGGKPVFCSNCFSRRDGSGSGSGSGSGPRRPDQSNKKHDEISAKLDKILFLLQGGTGSAKEVAVKKPKKQPKKEKKASKKAVKKAVAKKVAVKKVAKKAAPKKAAKKTSTKKAVKKTPAKKKAK